MTLALERPTRRNAPPLVDSYYVAILLRNLLCWGWSTELVAGYLHVSPTIVARWRTRRHPRVELTTQQRIVAVYTDLVEQIGPSDDAAARAREAGYKLPFEAHPDGTIEDPQNPYDKTKLRYALLGQPVPLSRVELACAVELGLDAGLSPTKIQTRLHISTSRYLKIVEGRPG